MSGTRDAGWAGAVAHQIRQSHPIVYRDKPQGGLIVNLECTTCSKVIEWHISKRYPPEAFSKKMRNSGWDVKKRRCPACVEAGRKSKQNRRPPPTQPRGKLQDEITKLFRPKSEPLPQIPLGAHMDVKIGVNDRNFSLSVPHGSPFFEAFVDTSKFRPKCYWSIELIRESPQGDPLVKLYRTKLAEGKSKEAGKAQGSYDSKSTLFMLMMSKSNISGINSVGMFRSAEARLVRQSEDEFIFELPKERKPPVLRGKDKDKRATGIQMMKNIQPEPEPKTIKSQPAENPTEAPTLAPSGDSKEKKVSFKQAIDLVNRHRDRLGDSCTLKITETGHLKAFIEYGPED